MPRGGARAGAGRPTGAATKRTREIADRAAESGLLPHEFLLAVVRGETIDGTVPTFADRLAAARAAAPFFAPKLSSVEVKEDRMRTAAELSDAELFAIIAATPEGQKAIAERDGMADDGSGLPAWVQVGSKLKQ